jgi:hypothetical protein
MPVFHVHVKQFLTKYKYQSKENLTKRHDRSIDLYRRLNCAAILPAFLMLGQRNLCKLATGQCIE